MTQNEGKEIMRELSNKEKIIVWGSKWYLGTFKEEKQRYIYILHP
jgi:hypothetical protein